MLRGARGPDACAALSLLLLTRAGCDPSPSLQPRGPLSGETAHAGAEVQRALTTAGAATPHPGRLGSPPAPFPPRGASPTLTSVEGETKAVPASPPAGMQTFFA